MIVQLRKLKPNSLRDFAVDPINEEAVERLMVSIREDGFWGGVVCRRVKDGIEIVAGHHRVEAALRCGIESADLFVSEDMDDDTALRIYARENATQRGMSDSTARAGSTAAALRGWAYKLLAWDLATIVARCPSLPEKGVETMRGQLISPRGLGHALMEAALAGVPGISDKTIKQDLASLKKSGHYARIIREVRDRITGEREAAERLAEAARKSAEMAAEAAEQEAAQRAAKARELEAEAARKTEGDAKKAAEQASKEAIVFDYDRVSKCFRVPHQLEVFRDVVTREPWLTYLPVEQQAEVAQRIVTKAKEEDTQPDGYFIRQAFAQLASDLFHGNDDLTEKEQREALQLTWESRYREQQNMFLAGLRGAEKQGRRLLDHLEEKPDLASLVPPPLFWQELRQAREVLDAIEEYYAKTSVTEGRADERNRHALGEPGRIEGESQERLSLCTTGA